MALILRLAIPARGRRLDDQRLAGVDHGRVAALEQLDRAIETTHRVLPNLPIFAARQAKGRHHAVAGQERALHLLEEADGAADAVAGIPFAAAARAFANMEVLEHDRIAKLENLRVSETRVGHVRVHRVGAGEARTRRGAGADRLVVLVLLVAEID